MTQLTRTPKLIPLSLSGDLRRGGWILAGNVEGDTDALGRTRNVQARGKSLAEFVDPGWRSWFNGHALADPDFSFTRFNSQANWAAGTIDNFLAGESLQDISFADVASPANSHEATSWNFGDVIEHILQDHTNYILDATGANGSPDGVVTETDIDTTNSTAFNRFIVKGGDNLWRILQNVGGGEEGGGEFYRIYVTRRNKVVYQPAPPFISPQPASKGTLNKEHIRDRVQVRFHNSGPGERIGQVQIKVVKGENVSPYFYVSSYPSNPGDGKIFKKDTGIWANSQARSDTLAERLYRWLTRSYTITIPVDPGLVLFGDDGDGLELGDRLLLTYEGTVEDALTGAGVHLDLDEQSMFVYGVQVRFDVARRRASASITLEHDNS